MSDTTLCRSGNSVPEKAPESLGYDVQSLAAHLRAGLAMIEGHPDYGAADAEHGVMLCDVGFLLSGAIGNLERLYDKLGARQLS